MLQRMTGEKETTSSKGNQNKWYANGRWYKEDGLGYEALTEVLVSRLLPKTSVRRFVEYQYEALQREDRMVHGCVSKDFMEPGDDKVVSVERLFQAYEGQSAAKAVLAYEEPIDKIRYVVRTVERATGLMDFGRYMREILTVDALFFNEDRHFHNIAVIRRKDGCYRECPVFDNGAALFSDVRGDYPLNMTEEECRNKIRAKPFSRDFDQQLDACELLFPAFPFRASFTMEDVTDVLAEFCGIYEEEVLHRVDETMRMQIRKYGYLFQ